MSTPEAPAKPVPEPSQPEIRTQSHSISLVWIVPIIAALVGFSMLVHTWQNQGPTLTLTFKTGEGLVANKTAVKYRNVVIGQVNNVELSRDRSQVVATVQLHKEAEQFATKDSVFWVVRPRIGATGISGVDTLVSGDFIGANTGPSLVPQTHFTGLESPPSLTYDEPGRHFLLSAPDLGSLDVGSPVYYRKIQVGEVVSYQLSEQGDSVHLEIFIRSPYENFVTSTSRFWNVSGVSFGVGANGVQVNTESLAAILAGGVAFQTPEHESSEEPAAEGMAFRLFAKREQALAPPKGVAYRLNMRFEQAIRGLNVGAPVEFLGVEIGEVQAIDLDLEENEQFSFVVETVLYPQLMGRAYDKLVGLADTGVSEEVAIARLLARFVERGLRAQVQTGSLLTGQLFISIDFHPDAEPVVVDQQQTPLFIPTVPSSLDQLEDQLQQFLGKINDLPLAQIAGGLDGSLRELRKALGQFNTGLLPGLNDTLGELQQFLQQANSTLAEDSPQQEQLNQTLTELERMSRSMRELSDYLGRHPEALLRGRLESLNQQPQGGL